MRVFAQTFLFIVAVLAATLAFIWIVDTMSPDCYEGLNSRENPPTLPHQREPSAD